MRGVPAQPGASPPMFPSSPPLPSPPRFVRLDETGRAPAPVRFTIDGRPATALEGDTLLVAMLSNGAALRRSEFGDGNRSGFCLMGACQDCWVWTADGGRLRACSTGLSRLWGSDSRGQVGSASSPIPTRRKTYAVPDPQPMKHPTRHTLLSSTPPKSRQPPGTRKNAMTNMTIIKAADVTSAHLPPAGRRPGADKGDPQLGVLRLAGNAPGNIGIWECQPGGWPVIDRPDTEGQKAQARGKAR